MLGEVTQKEFIQDLVEDLLGQPGLQEWETYHHATFHKERVAAKQAAPGWTRIWSYERSSSESTALQDEAPRLL